MKKLLLAFALSALTFTAAQAADAVIYEPPVETLGAPVTYDWSGLYLGAQGGYGWGKGRYISPDDGQTALPRPDGVLGGLYAGYNYQTGQWVYGLEADFNFHSASNIRTFSPNPRTNGKFDIDWSGSARVRLGYAVNKFMPFITGGVAIGRIYHDYAFSNSAPRMPEATYKDNKIGWTIGAGLEFAATENILTRIEYRYTDFGSKNFAETVTALRHSMEFRSHDIRFGIAYKF